ncbi:pyrrolo-quinoline quinone domain protein [Mycobacterium ulcerans str. Harvey]|uniref:Pyrrolo-quinoline quinone domain protein n=1 Tax=Mycobacterium ulcerans str. Harvey TaxID=1299332 RepID=A0ABP3AHV0_MYCUL|nr:pyrrolo-quinoline quinone domain protein [Mycobacterium ulcerans str. Harvey]
MGPARNGRQGEVVGAVGISGSDTADGHPGGPDRFRRRPDTRLAAFRDAGDHAYQAWRRDDVAPLSTSSLAAGNVGYTIVAGPPHEGGPGMSLLVFNPADGHTINSYSLPAATGYPVGVSIAVDGRVVTATSDGQVYSFAPA